MSEHLLIDLNQLYSIYSIDDIDRDYFEFDFLPDYNSIETEILYDNPKLFIIETIKSTVYLCISTMSPY